MTIQIDPAYQYERETDEDVPAPPKYRCCVCRKQTTRYGRIDGEVALICSNCEAAQR